MFECICLFKLSLFSTDRPKSKTTGSCGICIFDFRGTIILLHHACFQYVFPRVPFTTGPLLHLFFAVFWMMAIVTVVIGNLYPWYIFWNRILPPSLRLPPVLSQTKMPPNISSMLTPIIINYGVFIFWALGNEIIDYVFFGCHIYFTQHLLLIFQFVVTVVG